jgi:glycosyltransferase involved in cell wall biosynthesis
VKICFLAAADSIHSYRWVRAFREAGHQILWLSLTESIFEPIVGVRFVRLHAGWKNCALPALIPRVRHLLRDFAPDLLHVHYLGSYGLLGQFAGARLIVATPWGSDVIEGKKRWWQRLLVQRILRKARGITCDAQHMRAEVAALGIPARKVLIINFGIDTGRFVPCARQADLLAAYGAGDRPTVISLRNFEPVYDLATLIRAVPAILAGQPRTRILLVGRGSLKDELAALVAELGVEEAVVFTGFVENSRMPQLVGSMDVYVSTSLSDAGIAASTAEAMACGVPVVVSNTGENDRWIADGVNGLLVEARQPEALAKAVLRLLGDPALRRRCATAGRQTIVERNDHRVEMRKMDRIYTRLHELGGS